MIRRPPRSTQSRSSAASDVYKRQGKFPDCLIRAPYQASLLQAYGQLQIVPENLLTGIVRTQAFDQKPAPPPLHQQGLRGFLPDPDEGDHPQNDACYQAERQRQGKSEGSLDGSTRGSQNPADSATAQNIFQIGKDLASEPRALALVLAGRHLESWRRVERRPTGGAEVDLHPGMGIALFYLPECCEWVVVAAAISGHHPGRYAGAAGHDRHR